MVLVRVRFLWACVALLGAVNCAESTNEPYMPPGWVLGHLQIRLAMPTPSIAENLIRAGIDVDHIHVVARCNYVPVHINGVDRLGDIQVDRTIQVDRNNPPAAIDLSAPIPMENTGYEIDVELTGPTGVVYRHVGRNLLLAHTAPVADSTEITTVPLEYVGPWSKPHDVQIIAPAVIDVASGSPVAVRFSETTLGLFASIEDTSIATVTKNGDQLIVRGTGRRGMTLLDLQTVLGYWGSVYVWSPLPTALEVVSGGGQTVVAGARPANPVVRGSTRAPLLRRCG